MRWALKYKDLAWTAIDINAFSKKEIKHFKCKQLVPLIHDLKTGIALSDSSKIVAHLDAQYSNRRRLFPHDRQLLRETWRWLLLLDSHLGTASRRLGYAQLIFETPALLSRLFLPHVMHGALTLPGIGNIASAAVGIVLTVRFRLHRNVKDGIFAQAHALLREIDGRLQGRDYLVGDTFTAADLTLACLLRPLRIVPNFAENPLYKRVFDYQARMFARHGHDETMTYETAIKKIRRQRGYALASKVNPRKGAILPCTFEVDAGEAVNDQQPVYSWRLAIAPFFYIFYLRIFKGVQRVAYPANDGE